MFEDDETFDIRRFEVGAIINNNRYTIKTTNDIEEATISYEKAVHAHHPERNHVIIFLYDFERATNLNYYDSEVD